jgi:hypothetical protein
MGEQTLSLPLQELVSRQVDISSIRPQLLGADAPLGQVLLEFWLKLSGLQKDYANNH